MILQSKSPKTNFAASTQEKREAMANIESAIANLTQNVNQLTDDSTRILARDAFLNEMLLEMRADNKTEEIMEKLDQILEKLNGN